MDIQLKNIQWLVKWQNDLTPQEHTSLAAMLAKAYPKHSDLFRGVHSWYSAIPELRVIGVLDGQIVAHLGILRRFLRTAQDDSNVLVGDIGLVSTDPDYQGKGIGKELLRQTKLAMEQLELPFGFLTCKEDVVGFYESGGWVRSNGQSFRMIDRNFQDEICTSPIMVLEVKLKMSEWPSTKTVDRNRLEV